MRSVMSLLGCLAVLAIFPALAYAHGSNVFEAAKETSSHSHAAADADHKSDAPADEFEELHEQIHELTERLDAHDQRIRLTDILGGIGYIVGVTGAAYYYLGGRRKRL